MDTHTQARTATAEAQINDGSNTGQEMVVAQSAPPAGPKTVAQERKEKIEKVVHEIAKRTEDYRPFLAAHGTPFEVFTSIIKQALIKNTDLLACSTASILQAALYCAKDGLMPDGRDAAIVPFKTTATYMPMWQGMLKVAYGLRDDTGHLVYADVNMEVVYEDELDRFDYVAGTSPSISFRPALDRNSDGKIAGAFCVIRTSNGGQYIEVIGAKELGKIAAVGKAGGPRKQWPAEFARKDVLRRLLKRTPKDDRLRQVLAHDDENIELVREVEADDAAIPNDRLFDDTAHQAGAPAGDIQQNPASAESDEAGADLVAQARGDLMAAQTEAQLQEVIDAIVTHTSSSNRRKKGFFIPAERDGLLENAEALRKAKFGGSEGGAATTNDAALDDDADAEGLEGISEAQDRLDAEMEAAQETFNPAPVEARPTETASAQSAAPSPASPDSATAASTASPAASSSPGGSAAKSPAGPNVDRQAGALIALADLEKHFALAPQGQRMTPMEAELADPQIGVHFKRGLPMNQTGQIPYFNGADQILGFAKPDRDIAWRDWTPPAVGDPAPLAAAPAAGKPAATAASSPSPSPSATSTPPSTTAAPAGGATSASPSDDGYGEAPFAFQLMYDPKQPPREYADAAVWRDALLFKMSALRKEVGPLWWRDNKGFVEAAIPHAKPHCGKIITVAVSKGWPGAAELVDQYGPFA